jgi:hypothetical protein
MNTITIPSHLIREKDLVLIPRRDYERLLFGSEIITKKPKRLSELDKRLNKALEEVKRGEVYGPFDNVVALRRSLRKFRNPK